MRRLWIYINGYDDPRGLERACRSVRANWPDPDKVPIVYADGAYAKFPHEMPFSSIQTLWVGHQYASFVVAWPNAAPVEYLKRTSYWAGNAGDYALILDTDETITITDPAFEVGALDRKGYLIEISSSTRRASAIGRVCRLFRIENGMHHWGSHETVFRGTDQIKRARLHALRQLRIIHHSSDWSKDRLDKKKEYYGKGIREDETMFRRKVGA